MNSDRFFKSDFKFNEYLSEQLLTVSDDGERSALKEVLQHTLLPFYEYTEDAYSKLESRLFESKENNENRFEIITGLAERNKIDRNETDFCPMDMNDIDPAPVNTDEITEALACYEPYYVFRIYMEADKDTITNMLKSQRRYPGRIYTNEGEYTAEFAVKKSTKYIDKIASLYDRFITNGVSWNTVFAPYCYKFLDVYIVSGSVNPESEILKITVDFEEFSPYVKYNMVPMWNIREFEEKTSAYPNFSVDRINYEHCIYSQQISNKHDYMVENPDLHIWDVYSKKGEIVVICDCDKPVKWNMTEFSYDILNRITEYPIFRNCAKVNKDYVCIHTKAGINALINRYGLDGFVLKDIRRENTISADCVYTYNCDAFIEDEIRNESTSILIFSFAVSQTDYLTMDILSFLISKLQWLLPEYKCVGELI